MPEVAELMSTPCRDGTPWSCKGEAQIDTSSLYPGLSSARDDDELRPAQQGGEEVDMAMPTAASGLDG